jgi:hypothetical protein
MQEAATLVDFPKGSCGDASILLGEYFLRQGERGWVYIAGRRKSDGYTHAWIEKKGLIVDITSDQFDDGRDPVNITRDRTWHEQFEVDPGMSHAAEIDVYTDGYAKDMLNRAYKIIEGKMTA